MVGGISHDVVIGMCHVGCKDIPHHLVAYHMVCIMWNVRTYHITWWHITWYVSCGM